MPDAGVAHEDFHESAAGRAPTVIASAGRRVLDGVVQQVAENLRHGFAVAADLGVFRGAVPGPRADRSFRPSAASVRWHPAASRSRSEWSKSNFWRFCSTRESVSRSSVSRARRSALWRMMPRKRMLCSGSSSAPSMQRLGIALDGCQRRAQLVRHIDHEILADALHLFQFGVFVLELLDGLLQVPGGLVEGAGKLPELAAARAARRARKLPRASSTACDMMAAKRAEISRASSAAIAWPAERPAPCRPGCASGCRYLPVDLRQRHGDPNRPARKVPGSRHGDVQEIDAEGSAAAGCSNPPAPEGLDESRAGAMVLHGGRVGVRIATTWPSARTTVMRPPAARASRRTSESLVLRRVPPRNGQHAAPLSSSCSSGSGCRSPWPALWRRIVHRHQRQQPADRKRPNQLEEDLAGQADSSKR